MKFSLALLFGFLSLSFGLTQTTSTLSSDLPKVFLLGEYEQEYEQLVMLHEASLLSVCENDMSKAFKKWISMNQEMEVYANQIEYDINGIKLWLHVFWKKDGSIKHIGYYLRPNSKNVDLAELNAFLSSFMNHYKFPLTAVTPYAHYSFAQFPIVSKSIKTD